MSDSDRYEDEMWQDGFEVGYENGLEHSGDSDEDEEELFNFQNTNEDADECDHDYDEDDEEDTHIDEHEDNDYHEWTGDRLPGYRRRQFKRFIKRKFKPDYDW